MAGIFFLDDAGKEEYRRIQRKLDGAKGDGVINTPDALTISDSQRRRLRSLPGGEGVGDVVLVKITGVKDKNGAGGSDQNYGGCKYVGGIVTGLAGGVKATPDLSMPEGMTDPAEMDCIILSAGETPGASHSINYPSYAIGVVRGMSDDYKPRRVVVITSSPAFGFMVQVASTKTGAGFYGGFIWNPPSTDPDPTTDLTAAMLGATGAAVTILSLPEVGQTGGTHWLDLTFLDVYFHAKLLRIGLDGTIYVTIDRLQSETCSG